MPKHFTRAFLTVPFVLMVLVAASYGQQADIPPAAPDRCRRCGGFNRNRTRHELLRNVRTFTG
jgi:hypothetical protein